MKSMLLAAALILSLAPATAFAQERAGDAALGAVSGAVVLGPIGAVAGAFVGYAAGPSIAHSWGLRHSQPAKARRPSAADARRTPGSPPPSRSSEVAANGSGRSPEVATSSKPATQPAPSAPAASSMPPVQGFD